MQEIECPKCGCKYVVRGASGERCPACAGKEKRDLSHENYQDRGD